MRALITLLICACAPTVIVGTDTSTSNALGAQVGPMCTDALPSQRTVTETNHCIRWPNRALGYVIDSRFTDAQPDPHVPSVERAFATWQTAANECSDLVFTEAGRAFSFIKNDGINVVKFHKTNCEDDVPADNECWADLSCGNDFDCWAHDATTVGLTTMTYRNSTGELIDGDIEINGADFKLTTDGSADGYDVQATVTHEIGHWLGLSHTTAQGSTMQPTSSAGELDKRVLDSGSKCFLCTVYPSRKPSVDCL